MKYYKTGYLILMYHSVSNNFTDYLYNMKINDFKKQIMYLSNNFKIIPSNQIIENLKEGVEPQDVEIALTFDDGYQNNYVNVYPYLKKHGIPATFFINTGFLQRDPSIFDSQESVPTWWLKTIDPMDKDQINEIAADEDLFTVGSHTHTHPFLSHLSSIQIETELKKSKQIIEEWVGKEIYTISYPHGSYNDEVINIAKKVGYRSGFTSENKLNHFSTSLYKLGRYAIINSSVIRI